MEERKEFKSPRAYMFGFGVTFALFILAAVDIFQKIGLSDTMRNSIAFLFTGFLTVCMFAYALYEYSKIFVEKDNFEAIEKDDKKLDEKRGVFAEVLRNSLLIFVLNAASLTLVAVKDKDRILWMLLIAIGLLTITLLLQAFYNIAIILQAMGREEAKVKEEE